MSSLRHETGVGVGLLVGVGLGVKLGVGVFVGVGVGVFVGVGVLVGVGVGVGNTTVRELFVSLFSTMTFVESAVAVIECQVHTGSMLEQDIEGVRQVFAG